MKKVYILQKDLPDAKAGDEYILRGDMYRPLTAEQDNSPVIETNSYFKWQVENNPDWFKPKEEAIKVRLFGYTGFINLSTPEYSFKFVTNDQIPTAKYEAVKKAIEDALNFDPHKPPEYLSKFTEKYCDKMYTEKEHMEKLEAAFKAGRTECNGQPVYRVYKHKHFNEYINSQK